MAEHTTSLRARLLALAVIAAGCGWPFHTLAAAPTAKPDATPAAASASGTPQPDGDQPASNSSVPSAAPEQATTDTTTEDVAALAKSLDTFSKELEAFARGPNARFAPQTTEQARAVLGAAIVARRHHDAAALKQSLSTAQSLLASARKLAKDFRSKHAEILKLEQAAREAAGDIPAPDLVAAERKLDALARTVEAGDLNRAASLRDETRRAFLDVLKTKLPSLLDKTDAALVQARRAGAKRYAPTLYEAARQWLAGALAWVDGASRTVPEHPRRGLELAAAAKAMAQQVKQWRKHPDSFERLVLKARKERLMLARALNLPVDENDPLADVPVKTLTQAIARLDRQLQEERRARQQEKKTLRAEYERRLQAEIEAARQEALAAAAAQMKQLKEAFRAKLERETFETRRLKALRKLFRKGEVNIMANLDGSVLIRLSALKFAPGKSALDRKYFDMLRRLKQGLELYPNRKIVIEGHTDNRGDARANQILSLKRAEGVRDFLIASGIPAARLKALGYGEVHPIASNDYERGREMNRRIDIIIQPPATK